MRKTRADSHCQRRTTDHSRGWPNYCEYTMTSTTLDQERRRRLESIGRSAVPNEDYTRRRAWFRPALGSSLLVIAVVIACYATVRSSPSVPRADVHAGTASPAAAPAAPAA